MNRAPLRRNTLLGGATCYVSTIAVGITISTGAAMAQANQRMIVAGYVAPRCWVLASAFEAAAEPRGAEDSERHVRCNTRSSRERIEREIGQGGLRIESERTLLAEAQDRPAFRVTVTPVP